MKASTPDMHTGIATGEATGDASKHQHDTDPSSGNKHIGTDRHY